MASRRLVKSGDQAPMSTPKVEPTSHSPMQGSPGFDPSHALPRYEDAGFPRWLVNAQN